MNKIRPDNSPLVDLTQHRRPDEYEKSSYLACIGGGLALVALGVGAYFGIVYMVIHYWSK
jgi:hypothetical protein